MRTAAMAAVVTRTAHLTQPALVLLLEQTRPNGSYSGVVCKVARIELEEVNQPARVRSAYSDTGEGGT